MIQQVLKTESRIRIVLSPFQVPPSLKFLSVLEIYSPFMIDRRPLIVD